MDTTLVLTRSIKPFVIGKQKFCPCCKVNELISKYQQLCKNCSEFNSIRTRFYCIKIGKLKNRIHDYERRMKVTKSQWESI